MTYIHPWVIKLLVMFLIMVTGIFVNWVVFFLLTLPTFFLVHHAWKVDPPSKDNDMDWPDAMA